MLVFWLVVDVVAGFLMLAFGNAETKFGGLLVIGILLVTVAVVVVLWAVAGTVWGLEALFPHSGGRLEALAVDLFLLGLVALVLANVQVGAWGALLAAYLVVQVPLVVLGRTTGQLLVGFQLVHRRTEPRDLAGTMVEEAVFQLSAIQAALVLGLWWGRRSPGLNSWWKQISTRDRVLPITQHSGAWILGAILAFVLVGLGSCSMSLAPRTMADQAVYNSARACEGNEPVHPPTCLVEKQATVLDVHDDIVRDSQGNIQDDVYYIQVSISGQHQSLQADTTQGVQVIKSLYVGEQVTAGLWDGSLVLVRSSGGDVWQDGMRPGESSGAWLFWLGFFVFAPGIVIALALRIVR